MHSDFVHNYVCVILKIKKSQVGFVSIQIMSGELVESIMLTLLCLVEQLFSWNIDGLLKDKTSEQVFRKNNLVKLCRYVDIWSPEQMGATQAERLQCPKG